MLTNLLNEEHEKHPSYGYHRLAHLIRKNTGWMFSDNLAHKCCKNAAIRSTARKKYKYWSYVNILDIKSQTFLCCTSC
jgi:putative transposase